MCFFEYKMKREEYRDQIFENIYKSKTCFLTITRCQNIERFFLKKKIQKCILTNAMKLKKNVNNHNVFHVRKFIFYLFSMITMLSKNLFLYSIEIFYKRILFSV